MDSVGSGSSEESIVDDDEEQCMVCLTKSSDFAPLMRPSSFFVSDCKCKYLSHERCMTAWVRQQINEHKQLLCPHCNSVVALTVDYGLFLKPTDTCIDMPIIMPTPRRRTMCEIICDSDRTCNLCGCFCFVLLMTFLLFVIT